MKTDQFEGITYRRDQDAFVKACAVCSDSAKMCYHKIVRYHIDSVLSEFHTVSTNTATGMSMQSVNCGVKMTGEIMAG
jgi:hypothetical protein